MRQRWPGAPDDVFSSGVSGASNTEHPKLLENSACPTVHRVCKRLPAVAGGLFSGAFSDAFLRRLWVPHSLRPLQRVYLPWQVGSFSGASLRRFSPIHFILLHTIPLGHCTLKIHEPTWNNSNSFQLEIKSLPTPTTSVLIDISPIHPDCTSGNKLIVKTK
jgi:hypothetical protein